MKTEETRSPWLRFLGWPGFLLALAIVFGWDFVAKEVAEYRALEVAIKHKWHQAGTWNGRAGSKATDAFTVGSPWKITWQVGQTEAESGGITIFATPLGGEGISKFVSGRGVGEDIQHEAGTFYLQIFAEGPYLVTVWDST